MVMNQQRVVGERSQNRTGRRALFFPRRALGDCLTIETLQQVVRHQHRDQQEHQGFDTLRRMQKHRANGQRPFEAPIDLLAVALLFEFC